MYYVGLTGDLERRRREHGSPPDWHATTAFTTEQEARQWEGNLLRRGDCRGGPGGTGWRYGYWYTITAATCE